jgi:hypothetical protein
MSDRDPGLQPERTALSWRRTAWSMLVPAILCLRGWFHFGEWFYLICCGLLLTGILTMLFHQRSSKHVAVSLVVIITAALLMVITVKKYFLLL